MKAPRIDIVDFDRGCNVPWLRTALEAAGVPYRRHVAPESPFATEVLVYAPFPDPAHPAKFTPAMRRFEAEVLPACRRRLLVIQDGHDDGRTDACVARFAAAGVPFFWVKHTPGQHFGGRVEMASTHPLPVKGRRAWRRSIPASCRADGASHPSRPAVLEALARVPGAVATDRRLSHAAYARELARSLVAVCPPGWGPSTFRHLEAFRAGCLVLADASYAEVRGLPYADLEPGRHYAVYSAPGEIPAAIERWLADPAGRRRLAEAGRAAFLAGWDPARFGREFAERVGTRGAASARF